MVQKIEFEAKDMIDHFKATKADKGEELEMHNSFNISVLNVMWALMADQRYDLEDESVQNLVKYIQESFRIIDMSGGILNQFPAVRHIMPNLCGYKPLVETLSPLWKFLADTISQISSNFDPDSDQPKSLIEFYLKEMKTNTKTDSFTEDQLLCLCLDLFQVIFIVLSIIFLIEIIIYYYFMNINVIFDFCF